MPIVADWTAIRFPDNDAKSGTFFEPFAVRDDRALEIPFGTGGRVHDANGNRIDGVITLMVRGLNFGDDTSFQSGTADVRIRSEHTGANGAQIGRLQAYGAPAAGAGEDRFLWRQQQFLVPTGILSSDSGNDSNTFIIGRVSSGGTFDHFEVRDIVCHFHQQS